MPDRVRIDLPPVATEPEPRPPSMIPMLAAVLGVTLLGVAGSLVIVVAVKENTERIVLIAGLTGFLMPTLVAFLGLLKASENAKQSRNNAQKLQALTVNVDGRLTKLLDQTSRAERSEGHANGLLKGRELGALEATREAERVAAALATPAPAQVAPVQPIVVVLPATVAPVVAAPVDDESRPPSGGPTVVLP